MAFKLGMMVDLCMACMTFNLDARSEWVIKGKNNQRLILWATKQAVSIHLVTTVGHFLHDLNFENVYMA